MKSGHCVRRRRSSNTVRGEIMKEILITAFEPFGGSPRNASAEVLRLLPDEISGCSVRKMLLPVIFGKAAEAVLQQEADAAGPLSRRNGQPGISGMPGFRTMKEISRKMKKFCPEAPRNTIPAFLPDISPR